MNKTTVFLLALAMTVMLASCGTAEDKIGEISTGEAEISEKETTAETTEPETAAKGENSGTTYRNDSAGIMCELDDSWTLYSEEELAMLAGSVTEVLNDDGFEKLVEAGVCLYDFYAYREDGANLNITIAKIAGLESVDEKKYVETVSEGITESMSGAEFKIRDVEIEETLFAGERHSMVHVSLEYQGNALFERIAFIKKGAYVFQITSATYFEDSTAELMDMFTAAG